ncbi:MAG: YihY family inner membrane protein [Gammaproteobacteria bacterium]|nr:YihY family inner membrane protein [Gammaproteobacteria bacterium]
MHKLWQTLRQFWHRASYLVSRFGADRCSENAAALTYMSLFALVPLLTVLYTIATAVPVFQGLEEDLQQLLFEHLVPESSSDIETYLSDFSRQAKNLTGPGIAFLLITAVLMLRNIEKAFNLIWRARKNRSAVSSFLLYWAILTLAPITIGLALGVGTFVSSFAPVLSEYDIIGAQAFLLQFAPLLLATAGFSLVYVAVPNCHVPYKHALVGGLVAALAFNVARAVFTKFVVGSSITFIYGAFAAVPLFLMWIYISWNIVLVGCILVHSLSAYQDEDQASRPVILKALDVLYVFWESQQRGKTVHERDLVGRKHSQIKGIDSGSWGQLRDMLLAQNVITQSDQGHYLLSRDLHSVKLWQLLSWVKDERPLDRPGVIGNLPWQQRAHDMLMQQRDNQRNALNTSLAELFDQ